MGSEKTIKVLVDDEAVKIRGALPGFDQIGKTVEIGLNQLRESAVGALEGVYALLEELPLDSDQFAVDSVKFTLKVDANGAVALVSVAKAALGAQAGIEITLNRRSKSS